MNINQLERYCQETGIEKFKAVGPKGELKGEWLDVYLGLLRFEGEKGFVTVKDFEFMDNIKWYPIEGG